MARRRWGAAHIAGFCQTEERTDGAKESPVLVISSSGDADVVATRVVSRGEGGGGADSDADVVVTGVVSNGEGGAARGKFC